MKAIEVKDLSKRYRIGVQEESHDSLGGYIGSLLRYPVKNLKRLRELSTFSDEDESVFWALKDLNFEVNQGEVLGIIGKNGAGKSTLLKILSRVTRPTTGEITIRGRVASLLEVGTGFHPEMTGRENVFLNGTVLGMKKKEVQSKFDEIVDFAGVGKFIDTPIKRYSSGMKVRLGFAVAAHLEPEILIVDEVLAVGDFEFQKKCIGRMNKVASEGRTVLFVSHNMGAVAGLCNRAILLKNGLMVEEGKTDEVIQSYLNVIQSESQSKLGTHTGEDNVILHKVSLVEASGKSVDAIDINSAFHIEIEYDVLRDLSDMDVLISIRKEDVSVTVSIDKDQLSYDIINKGKYRSKLIFDPKTFVAGNYNIDVVFRNTRFGNHHGTYSRVMNFEVVELSEDVTHKGYAKKRGGAIVCPGKWDSKKLD